MSILLAATVFGCTTAVPGKLVTAGADTASDSGGQRADTAADPGEESGDTGPGGDSGGGGDSAESGADSAVRAWVRVLSPESGATVPNPVTFRTEGEGVDTLALSADGWPMVSWSPAEDGWSATYTFSGTGVPREVLLEGFDAGGAVVASHSLTITVEPDEVSLDVPYFYQYDNRYEPGATCGITSTAMAVDWWFPGQVTPDQLYVDYGKAQGQSPGGIEAIYEAEGLYGASTYTGTRDRIRAHLDLGRPVVAHGWWTGSGHVVTIVGYTDADWIVNDPAGDWYECYGCGQADHVRYPMGGDWDEAMGADGDLWYSVSDVGPI